MRDVTDTARGVSDGSGDCTVRIRGPHRIGTRWALSSLVLQSERVGDGTYPTASVYRSVVTSSALLGESRAADADTMTSANDHLLPGDQLVIVFANTAPSSTCIVNMSATETG